MIQGKAGFAERKWVLRLRRLMCGKASPFRELLDFGLGYAQRFGAQPQINDATVKEGHRPSAYQAAKPPPAFLRKGAPLLFVIAKFFQDGKIFQRRDIARD